MSCQYFAGSYVANNGYIGPNLSVVPATGVIAENYPLMLISTGAEGTKIVYGVLGDNAYVIFDLSPIDPRCDQKYDCINGSCYSEFRFGTQGKYLTKAACQSACSGNGTGCDGECVSAAEIAALQQAASKVRKKLCG
jgi:hypothetical protein